MKTRRRSAVALVAGSSGIAIIVGGLVRWVGARGRRPASGVTQTSFAELFRWHYVNSGPFLRSFGAVLVASGILVVLGALIGSRLVVALFSVLSLTVLGLWIGLNASHFNPTDLPYSDLRVGAWLVLAGGIVGLMSTFFLRRPAVDGSRDQRPAVAADRASGRS